MKILIASERPEAEELRQVLESAGHLVDVVLVKKLADMNQKSYDFVMREPLPNDSGLRNGNLELFAATHILKRNKKAVRVTPLEFKIVQYFLEHIGKVVTKEDLARQCWGRTEDVSHNMIQVYIRRLRMKLGDSAIRTVHGVGYQMVKK